MAIQFTGKYPAFNVKDKAGVDVYINAAHRSYKKAREIVQVAAVAVLRHAEEHGDWTKASTLVDGLEGMNRKSLVDWFKKFGGLTTDSKGFTGFKGAKFIRENFDAAKSNAWWGVSMDNPYAGYDLVKDLAMVVTRANNALKIAHDKPEQAEKVKVDLALLQKVRDLAIAKAA